MESRDDLSTANHYFRVTIHAINHCFQVSALCQARAYSSLCLPRQMIEVVGFESNDSEMQTLVAKLAELRDLLLDDFGEYETLDLRPVPTGSSYHFGPNEILFAEVTLALRPSRCSDRSVG